MLKGKKEYWKLGDVCVCACMYACQRFRTWPCVRNCICVSACASTHVNVHAFKHVCFFPSVWWKVSYRLWERKCEKND